MITKRFTVRAWSITGAAVISLLGIVLHYVYSWSGQNRIIGSLVPVNESVWEHLKLGYGGVILFSFAEYPNIKSKVNNYFLAKLTGILALELCILVIHYSYFLFYNQPILWIDISSFLIAVLICQLLSYKIYFVAKKKKEPGALSGIIVIGVVFIIMTYYPPHWEIFRDGRNNTIGIDQSKF